MRNYIILNGKNSNEINGLLIQELPPISKPLIRTEVEEIDGRDGDIVTPLGYSAYDKELTIGLYKDFDVNEVAAYFNSEGTVIFSNEPDKYYYYQITAQIDFERLVRYRTATVTMHCQPFKYSATEQPITEDVSGTVSDEGTNLALENTAEAPFNTLDLKGNTSQQTYTGKNLLKLTNGTYSKNSVTAVVDNGVITLSGTASAVTYIVLTASSDQYTLNLQGDYKLVTQAASGIYNVVYYGENSTMFNSTGSQVKSLSGEYARIRFQLYIPNGTNTNGIKISPMIIVNGTDESFEPYVGGVPAPNPDYPQAVQTVTGENVVKITGKNLIDQSLIESSTFHGLTISATPEKISVSGTTDTSYPAWVFYADGTVSRTQWWPTASTVNTTKGQFCNETPHTLSINVGGASVGYQKIAYFVGYMDGTWSGNKFIPEGATSVKITTEKAVNFIAFGFRGGSETFNNTLQLQLELGSTATAYEPYQEQSYPISLGSIELCNIPGTDYRDRFIPRDGKWYVHKVVGKHLFNGSETFTSDGSYNSIYQYKWTDSSVFSTTDQNGVYAMSDRFMGTYYNSSWTKDFAVIVRTTHNALRFMTSLSSTISAFQTWLAANPTTVYYPLATPTDTEITNEALIEQLDNIYYHAHAYKGRTHITSSAATGNVPHIIAAEVGEDNESTITNAGNYLSKPKITVYGSGDISLYINDMHVLQITLGDEGYITIDTAQMEAYKDTLDNLKNRLVIGDYSNARLKPGANKVHFTGTVTKYIVENYSRWL